MDGLMLDGFHSEMTNRAANAWKIGEKIALNGAMIDWKMENSPIKSI